MRALDEEYLSATEAAGLLRVAPSTIRRWIREGDVPAYRIGRRRVALGGADLATLITPTQPDPEMSGKVITDEEPVIRRLTPEEQKRGLEAIDRAERRAKEIQARRGGRLFSPSWEIINEQRDGRTRQLS